MHLALDQLELGDLPLGLAIRRSAAESSGYAAQSAAMSLANDLRRLNSAAVTQDANESARPRRTMALAPIAEIAGRDKLGRGLLDRHALFGERLDLPMDPAHAFELAPFSAGRRHRIDLGGAKRGADLAHRAAHRFEQGSARVWTMMLLIMRRSSACFWLMQRHRECRGCLDLVGRQVVVTMSPRRSVRPGSAQDRGGRRRHPWDHRSPRARRSDRPEGRR